MANESGEDGELSADVQKALIRLRMDDPRITDQTPRAKAITTLEHALRALLAERDGLKRLVDEISAEKDELEAAHEDQLIVNHGNDEKLSASNAALADALGLLRDCHLTTDGNYLYVGGDQDEREWLARRDALLTRHSK